MKDIISSYRRIGIIGLSKNSGKTTTLNYMLSLFPNLNIGLTSIGLDGEAFDQVNFLPKPKIHLTKGMVVATASTCLSVDSNFYHVLMKTNIDTALGCIMVIKIIVPCRMVIAGPTTNKELAKVIELMNPYVDKLFVDGAFNRMTFSNLALLEGVCLAAGAAYHSDMDETIAQAKWIEDAMSLKQSKSIHFEPHQMMVVETRHMLTPFNQKTMEVMNQLNLYDLKQIYIKGAVTKKLIDAMIKRKISHIKLIAEDWTKFLFSHKTYHYLNALNISLEVVKPSKLLLVTINPYSPSLDHYDKIVFLNRMKNTLNTPVFNVLEMEMQCQN